MLQGGGWDSSSGETKGTWRRGSRREKWEPESIDFGGKMLHSEWDTVFLRCSWDSKEGEVLFISILTSSPHLRESNV